MSPRPPPPLPFLSLTTAATTTNSPSYIHLHFHFHPRHRPFAPQRYAEAYFPSTSSRAFSSRTPAEMDSQSRPSTSIAACRELAGRPGARILALCGAGLSAASGLPTFRGAGGLWRNHDPTSLATPDAFAADPGLVWLFYAWRRHMALRARPNRAHYALAALAKANPDFLCLSQNVDGECSERVSGGAWGSGSG
ncbi:hypothetical protein SLS62_001846 [Diatrype stigma]|uniref:Deacetylase sirtuin-type domain-containing protein n=1 Tax=Diatrype stigma TaxID=117547 RepID=A0AAN9UZJ5_9PEZI